MVEKNFPNAFRATDLEPRLRAAGVDHLVIAGAMSHMCIDATARAAFDHGFKCTVAEDACATRALEFAGRTLPARDVHAAFMAALAVPYARSPGGRVRRRTRRRMNASTQETPMQMDANPLLDFSGLPRFAAVKPEHIAPAIDQLLADNRALIDELTRAETPATWAGFAQPLEDANERLGRAWGVVGHLHAVLDSPELREAYKENQPKVVQYWTALGQNLALFEKYKALRAGPEFERLTRAQRKIVENEIRDFRLSGAELPPEKKQRYAEIQEESAKLATKFAENALDSTNAFAVHVEERAALAGIPDDVLEPRAPRRRRTAGPAGSSCCTSRPTCRSCSTRRTAACARSCTAARSRAHPRSSRRRSRRRPSSSSRTNGKPPAEPRPRRRDRAPGTTRR